MTHRRKTVRDAFAAAATGLALTGSRVYKTRSYALAPDELPALRVSTPTEQMDAESSGFSVVPGIGRIRLLCEAVAKAGSAADDQVDAICEQVEAAMEANRTLSGAVMSLRLVDFDQQESTESDQPVVVGRMTFEAVAAS